MAISSQLPQTVSAVQPSALQALALRSGQVLEARVIGPAPNGGTQVQIAGQSLNIILPNLFEAGTVLKLEVQGTGPQLKLAIQPSTTPTLPAQGATPTPPVPQPLSATTSLPLELQAAITTSNSPPTGNSAPAPAPAPASQTNTLLTAPPSQPLIASALPAGSSPPATVNPQSSTPMQASGAAAQPVLSPQPGTPAQPLPASPSTNVQMPIASVLPTLKQSQAAYQPPGSRAAEPSPVLPASSIGSAKANTFSDTPGTAVRTQAHVSATSSSPVPATTPQSALTSMVQSALAQQDSVGKLMSALGALAGTAALPKSVTRAAQQVLAGRLNIDSAKLDGTTLRNAVLNSGLLQEANLAQGQLPLASTDGKTALLALRQALTGWLGPHQAALSEVANIAPPLRGQVPRASGNDHAPIEPEGSPQEIGEQLLERTEASLSRLRLHQNASLPDPITGKTSEWSVDLPVLVGSQQTVLHLQVHSDPDNASHTVQERGWRMRFALSLPQLGEVGAQVSLRGGATGVMLWATERQTSDVLEAHIVALHQTLAEIGLRPGSIIVRHGEPPAATSEVSGHFLDAST